jgi:hypothetical protein
VEIQLMVPEWSDYFIVSGNTTSGTSYQNGSYTNNDYIQSVTLNGASGTSINTNFGATNNNTGLPGNLPCLCI